MCPVRHGKCISVRIASGKEKRGNRTNARTIFLITKINIFFCITKDGINIWLLDSVHLQTLFCHTKNSVAYCTCYNSFGHDVCVVSCVVITSTITRIKKRTTKTLFMGGFCLVLWEVSPKNIAIKYCFLYTLLCIIMNTYVEAFWLFLSSLFVQCIKNAWRRKRNNKKNHFYGLIINFDIKKRERRYYDIKRTDTCVYDDPGCISVLRLVKQ